MMNLVRVETVNFGKSELTNYRELLKVAGDFIKTPSDVVLFISMSGNQIMFVHQPIHLRNLESASSPAKKNKKKQRGSYQVLESHRLRFIHGERWSPLMLGEYADRVGLKLANIQRFKSHFIRMEAKKGR